MQHVQLIKLLRSPDLKRCATEQTDILQTEINEKGPRHHTRTPKSITDQASVTDQTDSAIRTEFTNHIRTASAGQITCGRESRDFSTVILCQLVQLQWHWSSLKTFVACVCVCDATCVPCLIEQVISTMRKGSFCMVLHAKYLSLRGEVKQTFNFVPANLVKESLKTSTGGTEWRGFGDRSTAGLILFDSEQVSGQKSGEFKQQLLQDFAKIYFKIRKGQWHDKSRCCFYKPKQSHTTSWIPTAKSHIETDTKRICHSPT